MSTIHNVLESDEVRFDLGENRTRSIDGDCIHQVVDEDGNCRLERCDHQIPLSWLTDEFTHVVPSDVECECVDGPTAFEGMIIDERRVDVVRCTECKTELSYESHRI